MSTNSQNTQQFYLSAAIAGLTIVGSAYLVRKMMKLESEMEQKNRDFDKLIKEMSAKTDELNSISDMKTNSVDPSTSASSRINTQRTRNSNGDDIASLEAKISSIQMTLKSLEKVMHQQTGQIQMQSHYYEQRGSFGASGVNNADGGRAHRSSFTGHDKTFYIQGSKQQNNNLEYNMNQYRPEDKHNIVRICLTGGPCAGKTTAIASIKQDLTQLGITVLVVPEAATALMKGGAFIVSSSFTESQGLQFQKCLMKLQVALEDSFIEIGKLAGSQGSDVVILIDRGLMDGSAYVSKTQWQALMDDLGVSTVQIRDNRYDAVIHMVTAADGAENFYLSMESGEPRYESIEEAKQKDELLRQAYMGHQKWILVKNTECQNFLDKIEKTKEAVLDVIGKSAGTHFHKKFLLAKEEKADVSVIPLSLAALDQNCFEEIFISETFIDYRTREGKVLACSVEKKGAKKHFTYTHKLSIMVNDQKLLKKKNISASEYIQYKSQIKKGTITLKTKRLCIIDNGVYIIVDYHPERDGAPMLGIIQVRRGNQTKIELPPYIKVHREITDEQQYSPEIMAKECYYMDEKDKVGTNTPKDLEVRAEESM